DRRRNERGTGCRTTRKNDLLDPPWRRAHSKEDRVIVIRCPFCQCRVFWKIANHLWRATRDIDFPELASGREEDEAAVGGPEGIVWGAKKWHVSAGQRRRLWRVERLEVQPHRRSLPDEVDEIAAVGRQREFGKWTRPA